MLRPWLLRPIPIELLATRRNTLRFPPLQPPFSKWHYHNNPLSDRYLGYSSNSDPTLAQGLLPLPCNMKISIIPTNKLALLSAVFCAVMLPFSHNASALAITGDNQELGKVQFGILSGEIERLIYVNYLIGMSLGTTNSVNGLTYLRSNNNFGPLPTAVLAGAVSGTSTTVALGTGLYSYLFAKYNNPSAGSVVWYVGNLSGNITIPGAWGRYALSGWTLFGPGGGQVPDGGATVMLLGAALGALGMARRFLRS
jgi:hypothetical protein